MWWRTKSSSGTTEWSSLAGWKGRSSRHKRSAGYLIGLDRGPGTPRFLNPPAAPPVIGPNVLFDSVLRISPNGTGLFKNLVAGVMTPLNPADIYINGNEFTARVP
jgi:hypothetical protein